jgi:pantothenate synthetase
MDHPLVNLDSLKEKDMEELSEIISGLTNKLQFAYRLNRPDMVRQLQMAIESHRNIYMQKQQEAFAKSSNNSFGKIDIS